MIYRTANQPITKRESWCKNLMNKRYTYWYTLVCTKITRPVKTLCPVDFSLLFKTSFWKSWWGFASISLDISQMTFSPHYCRWDCRPVTLGIRGRVLCRNFSLFRELPQLLAFPRISAIFWIKVDIFSKIARKLQFLNQKLPKNEIFSEISKWQLFNNYIFEVLSP